MIRTAERASGNSTVLSTGLRFRPMSRRVALFVLILSGGSVRAVSAQTTGTCEARACTPADFERGVVALHDFKNAFVAALRQFAESAAGSYGDEGPRLRGELDALQRSLDAWDAGIAAFERDARAATRSADLHAALGTVYL